MNPTQLHIIIVLMALFILNIFYASHNANKNLSSNIDSQATSTKVSFNDPQLADKIMKLLYDYKPIDKRYLNHENKTVMRLDDVYLGLTQDDHYCNGVREWITEKVGTMIMKKKVFTDYSPSSLLRNDILKEMKADIQPEINSKMAKWLREKVIKMYFIRVILLIIEI